MARIAAEDRRTATAGNLTHLRALTGLDPVSEGQLEIKASLPVKGGSREGGLEVGVAGFSAEGAMVSRSEGIMSEESCSPYKFTLYNL